MTNHMEMAHVIASRILQIGCGNVSRHIDEILDYGRKPSLDGVILTTFFSEVVREIRKFDKFRTVIWVAGLSESEGINLNKDLDLSKFTVNLDKYNIYLFEGLDFIIDSSEEYKRFFRFKESKEISGAIYRSWRSKFAERNGWEFSEDVYIWSTR